MNSLSPNEQRTRAIALLLLPGVLWFLRSLPAGGLPHAGLWTTSCGAITGLPCVFCGLTRALHFLLNGNFARALYFNWLAFPLIGVAMLGFSLWAAELCLDRRLMASAWRFKVTRTRVASAFLALLLLWGLQVYLAVSQHKHELLNPAGPLYALIVR